MFATLFSFQRDRLNLRSTAVRDAQAYYDKHAGGDANLRKFKWLVAVLLGLVCFAAFANREVLAAEMPHRADPRNVSPATVFIDGPTEFVFVYTMEGWKFVRADAPAK